MKFTVNNTLCREMMMLCLDIWKTADLALRKKILCNRLWFYAIGLWFYVIVSVFDSFWVWSVQNSNTPQQWKLSSSNQGCLPFTRKNRKFRLEKQMVCVIPIGKFRKTRSSVWGNPLFPLFSFFSVDACTIRPSFPELSDRNDTYLFFSNRNFRFFRVNGKHPSVY